MAKKAQIQHFFQELGQETTKNTTWKIESIKEDC